MPTPFYHIVIAEEILDNSRLNASVHDLLFDCFPAFLFGNVAPDVQSISNYTREDTHFFSIDNVEKNVAYKALLSKHKELSNARRLSPVRSAFVAGYMAHLLLDQAWIVEVFKPVFGKDVNWGEFRERLFLHNVLRTFLDQRDYDRLPSDIDHKFALNLSATQWVPFIDNKDLHRWYKFVWEQLKDRLSSRTIEVFAARMDMEPEDFEEILLDDTLMEQRIFSRISRIRLYEFRQRALDNIIVMLNDYFSPDFGRV
ncbi:MAG: hypothetical protein CL789_04310 [Chloroflexi bacterium]|nr:hypothetical protein [Chloroflexota bacterium]|tara:strand:- start:4049 stop:4816 length:768 start_codon:yes stop_codon:yes gene_type:complete